MNNRFYSFLLSISTALFLVLFMVLSYFNRLAADDFYYLGGYSEKGVWQCMSDLYYGYSGRWAAYLLTGWIVSFNAFNYYNFVFNCITLFTLIFILYFLLKKILINKLNIQLSKKVILLYAILLTCSLFFSSYNIGETWFWLVQVCTYLWSIIMSLLLLNVLLEGKFKAIHIPVIILSTVFIGGASESFALVNIFLLIVCLFFFSKNQLLLIQKNKTLTKKIILALIFLVLAFVITMLAPGNEIRYGALPKVSFMQTIWIQIKSFIKIIFIKTPLKLHYLFLFSFFWFVLGKKNSQNIQKESLLSVLNSLRKYFFIFLLLIFLFLIPTSFIMSELGPDRALSQISFFITFGFAALFFYVGNKAAISEKVFDAMKFFSVVLCILILFFHLINQYSITKKYAATYDQRIELLNRLNKVPAEKVVELEPLPPSGMLYSAEISEDTAHFANNFLEYSLHLKFDTKRK